MGLPERMDPEGGTQRVFENGAFKHHARQCSETDTRADGVRDRDTHGPEAKHHTRRNLEVAVWACKVPGVPITNHYAVVLDEVLGRLRSTATLQIFLGGCNH